MLPTVGGWDVLELGERCVFNQYIEVRDFPLDLLAELIDGCIVRQVKEKEFNVIEPGRFLDFCR